MLLAVIALNVLFHRRDGYLIRRVETTWMLALVLFAVFLFSSRQSLAIKSFFYATSAFMFCYAAACASSGGLNLSSVLVVFYLLLLLCTGGWFVYRDGFLFGQGVSREHTGGPN